MQAFGEAYLCGLAMTDHCLSQEHSHWVNSLQIDDFQIVSGSRDDTILIRDFLDPVPPGDMQTDQSKDKKDLT